jgi:leader peptidase (prepilin peptidase) / N-methyltransferase
LNFLALLLDQLPLWFFASMLGILGAIWGSFAGALIIRWPVGESVLRGRSRCDHCNAVLRAHELVPILSYLAQSGKCRHCGQPISAALIGIEIAAVAIGLLCALFLPPFEAAATAVFCWLLLPLILLDWRNYWLPDALLVWLALAGLACGALLAAQSEVSDRLIGGVAGYAFLETLRRAYSRLRGIEAMGAGDPKFFGALGLWLGWQTLPPIMVAASVLGLADFVRRYAQSKDSGVRLPLGSYLGIAAMLWVAFLSSLAT